MYDLPRGVVSLIAHWRCPEGTCQGKVLPKIYNLACSFMRSNHDIHFSDEHHTVLPTGNVQCHHYFQMHSRQSHRDPTKDLTHGAT